MESPRKCARCGSDRIIHGASLRDQYGDMGMRSDSARVAVDANPEAIVFKGRTYGELQLEICGACGHVEMTATNYQALYDVFRQSREG